MKGKGSRLWKFEAAPSEASRKTSVTVFPSQSQCIEGCEWRSDFPGPMPILHISGFDRTIPLPKRRGLEFESIEVPDNTGIRASELPCK
ncbi:MAG: hypothetical protein Ct9H90mP16_17710 [Candidatus Poseidoniales archaeon]|nr:MAG: hypothetical protein Ct9H90mP16_17710 [Candidatus Poseidoniales archaeon]